MKAIVIRAHGGVEQLEETELPDPEPGAGEAVVAVRAVALNHLDLWVRRGVPGHRFPLPIVPGSEVAGVIEALGPGAGAWKAGDEVVVAPGYSCGHCVACLSGTAFGKHGDGFLRFSYANSVENIREALTRFARFLESAKAKA